MRQIESYLIALARWKSPDGCRLGLRVAALMILLGRRREVTTGEVARALCITPTAATGVVDRLVVLGWAKRTHDPLDRRRRLVRVTGRGLTEFAEIQ